MGNSGKSREKWLYVGNSSEKLEKVAGKVGKSEEKWRQVGNSGEKW